MRRMYSEKQLKEIAKTSIESESQIHLEGNLVVDGNITESHPKIDYDIPFVSSMSGMNKIGSYGKIVSNVNSLDFIITVAYSNNSDSPKTLSGIFQNWTLNDIPDDIAKNIFRLEGTNLTEPVTSLTSVVVADGMFFESKNNTGGVFVLNMYSTTKNSLQINWHTIEDIEIPAHASCFFNSRVSLKI